MPLNRFRNYQALLNLVPGTTPMAFGNAETDTPARSLATNVNGQANTNNSTRTDGATNMNIWLPNHNMYISPAETDRHGQRLDQQLRRRAGHGRRRGGHGRHQVGHQPVQGLGVRVLQQRQAERDAVLLRRRRGQAGASCRSSRTSTAARSAARSAQNKVFFFGSFEGYKRDQSLFTFFNVPDAALRSGDFSDARNADGIAADRSTTRSPATPTAPAARRSPNNQIPAEHDQPDRAEDPRACIPLPNTGGIGAGGLTNNYQRDEDAHGRPRQLRRQGELEPHLGAPDLGQVQLHGRGRRRPDQLPRSRIRTPRATAASPRCISSRRPDLDAQPDAADGHDVRLLAAEAGRARARLQRRQLRPRRARHPRHQRPGHRRPALRRLSRSSTPASARSATATAGTRSSATSAPTRSPPT